MIQHEGGMELWAIVPELILAGATLGLLALGPFLPPRYRHVNAWLALVALAAAFGMSARMLPWDEQAIFLGTYAVDPFAVYFKLFALGATAAVVLAVPSHFRGHRHEALVPAVLVLTCGGVIGLAASQDLALIALFVQLVTVGSYILVGVAKEDRHATEGAMKLFLFSAVASAVMLYGMSMLYGLTGSLQLPELAETLPAAPVVVTLAAAGLMVAGFGFKATLVPFHEWAPDTYQGAPTPIAGFLSVAPKAAGLAVLLRVLAVALPRDTEWPLLIAIVAAVTMSVGNVYALRQTSAKRMLAYSSIAQAGYLLVGVAAAGRDDLAVSGFLVYLLVYLFMNLGAFLAVDAIEQRTGSDDLRRFGGLGWVLPVPALTLTLSLLSLAGMPPLGGFVGKAMLFGAAIGADWTWLAAVMAANVAVSLYYYVRMFAPLYLERGDGQRLVPEPAALRLVLVALAAGSIVTGVAPEPFVSLAEHSTNVLASPL